MITISEIELTPNKLLYSPYFGDVVIKNTFTTSDNKIIAVVEYNDNLQKHADLDDIYVSKEAYVHGKLGIRKYGHVVHKKTHTLYIVNDISDLSHIKVENVNNGEMSDMPYDEFIGIEKFDPKYFNPFDKVLVRILPEHRWSASLFSYFDNKCVCENGIKFNYCIPYNNETKLLIGTTNNPNEFYQF